MSTEKPFLDRISQETRSLIEERGVARKWQRHSSLFRAREECTGLHILVDGLVKLYRSSGASREQIVLLEGAGSVLTLVPVLDRGRHIVSAETLKPSTTLFLNHDEFLRIYGERDDFREAIVMEMARRFRSAVALLEIIALRPVIARVAARIIDLASANNALDGSRTFKLLLSQEELSHVLATTRESVARALADLKAAGVIEGAASTWRVIDVPRLFEFSQLNQEESATPLPNNG